MNSFLETLKQLGPARLAIMGSVLLGLMIFFIFVSLRVSTTEMKLLYSDISQMDSGAMVAKLEESQIPYEVSSDGSRIMVGDTDVGRARMLLAEAGLPNGGSMGYELFDKQSGFGTTNAVQNINALRALEGELSRTIGTLQPIRSARVHLVLPQRELFARETRPASASVAVQLRPGQRIEREQIAAIQSLIASAVPELKMEQVSIIDQNGSLLARGGDSAGDQATLKAEELRMKQEQRLIQTIEDLVGRTVGYGKVRASVAAELNFDRVTTAEEVYNPEQQVARSTQTVEEGAMERDADRNDNVSVENNLPGVGGDTLGNQPPTSTSNRTEETTNFEISKTVRNTVREGGDLKRLSVAVLVDGTYATGEDGTRNYQPRSDAELDKIAALVRSAIGFDSARGDTLEVVNMQFAEIDTSGDVSDNTLFGFDKNKLLDVAEVITVAIMIILVILLVLQPMVGRLLSTESTGLDDDEETELIAARGMAPALEGPAQEFEPANLEEADDTSMIDVQKVEGKVKASSVKKVEDIVDAYPAETVSVIRSWMTQD